MLGGVAVSIGLPLFDVFLNGNGTALAGGGALPVRFGTWFWGNGMNPHRWDPATAGADYEVTPELLPLAGVKDYVNIFSGYNVPLDGRPNNPHGSAVMGLRTGTVPKQDGEVPAPTLDILIARQIGTSTRFRSLEIACTGVPNQSYSRESQSIINASSVSPLELYARIFGPDFFDPNDGDDRVYSTLQAAMAEKESADKARRMRRKHKEKASRGEYAGGPPPLGYRKIDSGGIDLVGSRQLDAGHELHGEDTARAVVEIDARHMDALHAFEHLGQA